MLIQMQEKINHEIWSSIPDYNQVANYNESVA